MEQLARDFRLALRGFRRSPSFTVTAIVILAVGIGMAVAMFTVFDAVLVRRLPVSDQDRVVELYTYRGDPNADYYLLREDLPKVLPTSRTLRDIASVVHWGAPETPMVDGDKPVMVNRTLVSGNFFDVLGARAVRGRLLRPSDEAEGAPLVMVISHGLWQKQFGGDPDIVGRRLLEPYKRVTYEIVGVAPPGLDYPAAVGVWMPNWQPPGKLSVKAVARLKPGASLRAAQSEFLTTMNTLYPDRKFEGVSARSIGDVVVGNIRPVLMVLAAAVALLLLIACVNVGSLLLLRATGRARELSIRRALGATPGDIARQLVVESTMLGIGGGLLGTLLAAALVDVLVAFAPAQLPRLDAIALGGAPLGIAIGVTLIAVLLFGVLPARAASRGQLATPLRFDSRAGTETRRRRKTRHVLVASQIALALVMVAGASLLGRTLQRLQGLSLGYTPEHLAWITVSFPPSEYTDSAGKISQTMINALGDRLLPAWRAIPGITSISPTLVPPFFGANIFVGRLDRQGQTAEEMNSNPSVPLEVGGADYFRTFGIPISRGRAFTDADDERAPAVAIVSEAVARRFWPNGDPIGQRIHYWSADSTTWRTIVGIAGDIHWRALKDSTPSVYLPWKQSYWQGSFAIRTTGDLASVLPALRRATREINPALTVWQARSMDELLAQPLSQPRLSATLLGAFALVSLLLAAIGLYGVMANAVRASTRELGVRAALGASPGRLRREVLGQALMIAGAGAIVGLALSLVLGRLVSSLLFGVTPADPISLGGAAALLLVIGVVASYLPARRATRVNPVEALRSD